MQRWRKAHADTDDSQPIALGSEAPHGTVIDAVNDAAQNAGAKAGQKLTDARAICPALIVESSDPAGDADWLIRLGCWAQCWSPWTAVDGADGLLLDSTGASHLFDGETAMLADMQSRFGDLGLTSRIAIAPTIGGAWALAHYGDRNRIIADSDTLDAALAPLPVESLRIDSDDALLLRRLGLKTVGALAAIPVSSLARRFRKTGNGGVNPLRRLEQALGRVEEIVAPLAPQTRYRAAIRVADPVLHVPIVEPILSDLADRLCRQLENGQRGLRRVRFEAFRVDGHIAALTAETAAPVRKPDHICRLFAERLETLDAGCGFDAFALTAIGHEAMPAHQNGLEENKPEGLSLSHLIDRLSVRIGAQNVCRPIAVASHVPERSVAWRPGLDEDPSVPAEPPQRERPIRLFDRPEPIAVIYATPEGPPKRFRWRRKLHDVVKVEGPERIAPEWWRERSTVRLRDYYKIEDEDGRRFWIYRNGVIDDGRGGPPEWFLHGLFA